MKLVSVFLLMLVLVGCKPVETDAVICKITLSVPDHSSATVTDLNQFLVDFWSHRDNTGWTLHPVTGSWRPTSSDAYMHEPSMIIEILGSRKNLINDSTELSVALEKRYNQKEVLVNCDSVIVP